MNILKNIQHILKKNRWLIALFISAFLVRMIFAYATPIKSWDETIYLNLGSDLSHNLLDYSFSHGWSDYIPSGEDVMYGYPKAGFRAPLLPYLIAFLHIFHVSFLITFLLPLVGALSVIVVYVLGKELFTKRVGVISALFFAFIPLHVFYSGRVLTEVLLTFFILLTFLSFWKGFEKGNKTYKILFGVFLALALLSRYTALWIVPVFPLYLLARHKTFTFLRDKYLWYSVAAFLILLTPWFVYGIVTYHNPIGATIHGAKASAYWGGAQSWHFFFDHWWQMFSIIGFVFVFALLYIYYERAFFKKEMYLLLLWFILFFGIALYMPHKEERFILPIVPAVALITGYFIDKNKYYKKIVIAIMGVLLISLGVNFYTEYTTFHNINTNCFQQVSAKLKKLPGDGLLVSESPSLFRYYAGKDNIFYPDTITEATMNVVTHSTNRKVYFVFTKFNSGFETEVWQNLHKIMRDKYHLVFACQQDREVNWIYSTP